MSEIFGWFEPITPRPGGSLVERFHKGPTKPFDWTEFAFPVYTETVTTIIKESRSDSIANTMTAAEFGFKACERGDNFETMLVDLTEALKL